MARTRKKSTIFYDLSHDDLNQYLEAKIKDYNKIMNNGHRIESDYDKIISNQYNQMWKNFDNKKTDALRAKIKSGAKPSRPTPPSLSKNLIDNIEGFTDQTHVISLSYGSGAVCMEYGSTQIVGMDKVEWWEYVLLYGFRKAFKLSIEYNKVKHLINTPVPLNRTKNLKTLIITLNPKNVRNSLLYGQKKLHFELPHKKVSKVEEYESNYFLYENKFETMEVDQEQYYIALEKFLKESKVHQSLINQVIK